jgi:hypothetical protein
MEEARRFYPPLEPDLPELRPFEAHRLDLGPGEQIDFVIRPDRNALFRMQTFGSADTVMVLFEEIGGEPRYYDGDDDSGTGLNARIEARLFRGRRYVLRLRLYYAEARGRTALMMW